MRLVDGALAIHGDLPSTATTLLSVPLEAGDGLETGVARCGSLRVVHESVRSAVAEALERAPWVLTVGGDCSVELGAIGAVLERTHRDPGAQVENLAVVWFDAHPDLNTPRSSPSGAFAGMVLRALTGDGVSDLTPSVPLAPHNIVLVGARDVDEGEAEFIAEHSITVVRSSEVSNSHAIVNAISATGATSVYIHIDLDVLDPGEIDAVDSPVPFGVSTAELLAAIRAITHNFVLAGAGIAQFSPASPEAATNDLPTILRIVGALTAEA